MAGFAAEKRADGPAAGHALVELSVMRVGVTCRAAHIRKMEWKDFVGASGKSRFVAIVTRDGCMSAGERKLRVAMLGDAKRGAMEICDGVAILAAIEIGSGGELPSVLVFVAIRARREFHLVKRVFAGGKMTLRAFDRDVLAA